MKSRRKDYTTINVSRAGAEKLAFFNSVRNVKRVESGEKRLTLYEEFELIINEITDPLLFAVNNKIITDKRCEPELTDVSEVG